jgi:hypothetical protein
VEPASVESAASAPPPADRPAPLEIAAEPARTPADNIGLSGERLTRNEAFDLIRRTVADLVKGDESVRASDVRRRARQLLGRDSESLSDRMFVRILKDAHDENIVDLRRRGDDFEVGRTTESGSVAEQVANNERAIAAAAAPAIPATPQLRLGMGPRGAGARGRLAPPPPELLSIGIVDEPMAVTSAAAPATENGGAPEAAATGKRGRGRGAAKKAAAAEARAAASPPQTPARGKRGSRPAAKKATRARARKGAAASEE